MGSRLAAVTGIAQSEVAKTLEEKMRDVASRLVHEALADACVDPSEVDALFVSPAGLAGGLPDLMLACGLAAYLDLPVRSLGLTECGGATATLAMRSALNEIRLGRCRHAVVFCLDHREILEGEVAQVLLSVTTSLSSIYGVYEAPYGIGAPIPYYAMSGQRYMHEFGVTPEEIARLPVLLREHAATNPYAQYRKPITVEDVLRAPVISPPLTLLECATFSAGAAAVVLSSPEAAGDKNRSVWITGYGEYHNATSFVDFQKPLTSFETVQRAAAEAFAMAGVRPPDIDVAEIYGVFAPTELMLYEDLGFFKKGTAARAVVDRKTALDGEVAMNPSGGRLSVGHPASTTPLLETAEIVRQLRGEASSQVRDAALGLVQSEHGMLNGSCVFIFEGPGA